MCVYIHIYIFICHTVYISTYKLLSLYNVFMYVFRADHLAMEVLFPGEFHLSHSLLSSVAYSLLGSVLLIY